MWTGTCFFGSNSQAFMQVNNFLRTAILACMCVPHFHFLRGYCVALCCHHRHALCYAPMMLRLFKRMAVLGFHHAFMQHALLISDFGNVPFAHPAFQSRQQHCDVGTSDCSGWISHPASSSSYCSPAAGSTLFS